MRRIFESLLLVAIAAGSLWLAWRTPDRDLPDTNAIEDLATGYFLDSDVVRASEDGDPLYRLRAARVVQEQGSDGAILEDVSIEFEGAGGEAWFLTADRGAIPEGGDRVDLAGSVQMRNQALSDDVEGSSPCGIAEILTQRLTIFPNDRYAETDAAVRIIDGDSLVTAIGLRAWLDEERLELQSRVRGTYEPG